jgi:hypothetical protein
MSYVSVTKTVLESSSWPCKGKNPVTDSRYEVWGMGCGHGAYAPLRYEVFAIRAVSARDAV